MINLRGSARFSRDRNQFIERFEKTVALAAQVRNVHAAISSRDLCQSDEFVGFCIERWSVDERRSNAKRTLLHGLANQLAHPVKLRWCRRTIRVANLVHANGGSPDKRGDVR